jgi:hypothetical protein
MNLYSSRYCPACCSSSVTESERRQRRHGDDVRVSCQDCSCTWVRYDRSRQRAYEALAGAIVGRGVGEHPLPSVGADVAGGCLGFSPRPPTSNATARRPNDEPTL